MISSSPASKNLCQLLPSFLARPILALAERRGWLGRVYFGMEINSTSISGYLRFLMLAKLRRLRPYGHRYAQEQTQIESWLGLIVEAARLSAELGLEVTECARLIKGYGDTYARGLFQLPHHRGETDPPGAGGPSPTCRARPMHWPARAPPLWWIRKAKASPNAWPRSTGRPVFVLRRSSASVVRPTPVA